MSSYRISCIREKRETEELYNEKARLEAIVTGFKSNNEEYLDKIKQAAEETVKGVLTDGKLILKLAILSVIESLRSNSELYEEHWIYTSTSRNRQTRNSDDLLLPLLIFTIVEKLYQMNLLLVI